MADIKELLNPKKKIVEIVETGKCYYFKETPEKNLKVKTTRGLIFSFDTFFSVVLVAFLIIANWRGTWGLMDIYYKWFPAYESFFFSTGLHVACAFIRDILQDYFIQYKKRLKNNYLWKFFIKFYIYSFNVICNMQWRAAWIIMDEFCEIETDELGNALAHNEPSLCIYITIVSIVLLAIFKSLRNISGPPFIIVLDEDDSIFHFPTRFRVQMVQRTSLYILDCLFSVLIVGSLVVFVWRGAWVLIDIYLFPQNEVWSAWASLIFGYIAVAIAFMLQPAMRWLCDRIDGALRLFAADIFLLFSLLGTLNVWRGIWNLLNIYFIPDDLELSCWITHWVSLILLILLGCSNSLLVRGVYIDAEEPAGKCVVFPCYYLRLIFQQERERKLEKNVQLEVMAKRKQEIDNKIESNNVVITMDSNHI